MYDYMTSRSGYRPGLGYLHHIRPRGRKSVENAGEP